MSLLKKLAGLVVEFPEEEAQAAGDAATAGDDALAAIEKIRAELENSNSPDYEEKSEQKDAADATEETPATSEKLPPTPPLPTGEIIDIPGVLGIPQVYAKAGIKAEQEFDIFKVEQMMADPEIADLDVAMRARMVKLTLKNMGRELSDILGDAGRRDQALETYLAFLERKVADTEVKVARSNASIQKQIDEFVSTHKAMIQGNDEQLALARNSLEKYKLVKTTEEERLFGIAAPFVGGDLNPVDVG